MMNMSAKKMEINKKKFAVDDRTNNLQWSTFSYDLIKKTKT